MVTPFVLTPLFGTPVTEAANGFGAPVVEASDGFGVPITIVASGGAPVVGTGSSIALFDQTGMPLLDESGNILQAGP